jgi:hypothetical protein
MTENQELCTRILRAYPDADQLSIELSNDKGPHPYQWKVNTRDGSMNLGYVILRGPIIHCTAGEKRAELWRQLNILLSKLRSRVA